MDDKRKSILEQLFESVNYGFEWGLKQVKNPCPPRKKNGRRGKAPSDTEVQQKIDDHDDDEEYKRQTRLGEGGEDSNDEHNSKFKDPCEPKGPHLDPDQICPNWNEPTCCYIPMQDPCRPCCCEPNMKEEDEDPCPPKKNHLDEPREPACRCEACERLRARGTCCPEKRNFFREENNRGRLESA